MQLYVVSYALNSKYWEREKIIVSFWTSWLSISLQCTALVGLLWCWNRKCWMSSLTPFWYHLKKLRAWKLLVLCVPSGHLCLAGARPRQSLLLLLLLHLLLLLLLLPLLVLLQLLLGEASFCGIIDPAITILPTSNLFSNHLFSCLIWLS